MYSRLKPTGLSFVRDASSLLPFGSSSLDMMWANIERAVRLRVFLAPQYLICFLGVLGIIGLTAIPTASGQAQHKNLTTHPKSQFWITGKATTHSFTCRVERVNGKAQIPTGQDSLRVEAEDNQTTVSVSVPVKVFCWLG